MVYFCYVEEKPKRFNFQYKSCLKEPVKPVKKQSKLASWFNKETKPTTIYNIYIF